MGYAKGANNGTVVAYVEAHIAEKNAQMADDHNAALLRRAQDILADCRARVISNDEAIVKLHALFEGSLARQAMAATSQDFVWHGSRPRSL